MFSTNYGGMQEVIALRVSRSLLGQMSIWPGWCMTPNPIIKHRAALSSSHLCHAHGACATLSTKITHFQRMLYKDLDWLYTEVPSVPEIYLGQVSNFSECHLPFYRERITLLILRGDWIKCHNACKKIISWFGICHLSRMTMIVDNMDEKQQKKTDFE